jgi:hypothetical protein
MQDRRLLAALGFVFLVALIAHSLPTPRTIDDAFITLNL